VSFIKRVASKLSRHRCKNIVKRYGTEFDIKAPDIEIGETKVNAGSYSSHFKEFVRASDLAVNLDNTQLLLCEELTQMKDADDELKDEIRRIRLQIILGISQLQNILDTRKAAKLDLGKELKAWIKNLGDLYNYAIMFLGPKPKKGIGKGKSAMKLARIMKYQGIDEKQLQQAINEMKSGSARVGVARAKSRGKV
jgi:hypothetical protein